MTPGTPVKIAHAGLQYHGKKGVIDHLFLVDGDTLCAVKLADGRIFGLPEIWLKQVFK
jgi:hypothetical protein